MMSLENKKTISQISAGEKITVIYQCVTTRVLEITVKSIIGNRIAYVLPRKRKENLLTLDAGKIVLLGHGHNIKADVDLSREGMWCCTSHGDCLINIGGLPLNELKDKIEQDNMNETFNEWDRLTYYTGKTYDEEGTPFYPETENN